MQSLASDTLQHQYRLEKVKYDNTGQNRLYVVVSHVIFELYVLPLLLISPEFQGIVVSLEMTNYILQTIYPLT